MHVYELDTDTILAALQRKLLEDGVDVREQTPAGIWWFHTAQDKADVCRRTAEAFRQVMAGHLAEVEQ